MYKYLLLFVSLLLSAGITCQVVNCPEECDDAFEQFEVFGVGACYHCDFDILFANRGAPNTCGGAIYKDTLNGTTIELDLRRGFRLPLRLGFGAFDAGGEGLVFILMADQADFNLLGEGGVLGYSNFPRSLGLVFDTHPDTLAQFNRPPFVDSLPYDYFQLVAYGKVDSALTAPVPIKANLDAEYHNVENDTPINCEIHWDPVSQVLEVYVNGISRMTHQIDLEEFFQRDLIHPGVLSCSGDLGNRHTLQISDVPSFNRNPRNYNGCAARRDFNNWFHLGPVDHGHWGRSNTTTTQLVNGEPVMLATHFPVIDAIMSVDIRVNPTYERDGITRSNNDRDMIGVAFGLNAPFAQFTDTYRGWLLDWMGDGVIGDVLDPKGIHFARMEDVREPLVSDDINYHDAHPLATRSDTSGYQLLDHLDLPTWDTGETYRFSVGYLSDSLWVRIQDQAGTEIYSYGQHHNEDPGRFALYNYSQRATSYSNFSCTYIYDYVMDRDTICPGEAITFSYDTSSRKLPLVASEMYWDFGDSVIVNALDSLGGIPPITHVFNRPGLQEVQLVMVDFAGCPQAVIHEVLVGEAPSISLGNDTLLCPGEVLLLHPESDNPNRVTWQDGTLFPTFLATQPGWYVAAETSEGGCISQDSQFVSYASPIDYSISTTADCGDQPHGSIEVLIGPEGGVVSASLNADTGFYYPQLIAGIYLLELADSSGCLLTDSLTIPSGINQFPEVDQLDVSCFGAADGTIDLAIEDTTLEITLGDLPASNQISYTNLLAGDYLVRVIDSLGCIVEETISIEMPPALLALGLKDTTIKLGETVVFAPRTNFGVLESVVWVPEERTYFEDSSLIAFSPWENTRYQFSVVNDVGCTIDTSILIIVLDTAKLYVPNAFSPNGDGVNDYFYPQAGSLSVGVEIIHHLRIYDRFGELVFEEEQFLPDSAREGWDGTFHDRELNDQLFVYDLCWERITGEVVMQKGDFVLLR